MKIRIKKTFLYVIFALLPVNFVSAKEPFDSTKLVKPCPDFNSVYNDFVNSKTGGTTDALNAQLAEIQKQLDDIDVKGNVKLGELNAITEEIRIHNEETLTSYNKRCLGRGLPPDEYSACTAEHKMLNATADRLNNRNKTILDTMSELKTKYDELDAKKIKLKADMKNLEQFEQESKKCSVKTSPEDMKQCMDDLWAGNTTK